MNLNRAFAPLAFAAALVAAPHLASAGEPATDRLTQKVTYDELNLDSEKGAQTLLVRLRVAARNVCEPLASGYGPMAHARWSACYDEALNAAVAAINKPRVSAAYHQDAAAPQG